MQSLYLSIRLFLGIIVPIFLGYNIILSFLKKSIKELNILEQIFISFGAGIAFISLELFVFSLLKIKWDYLNLLSPWLILILINLNWFVKNNWDIATDKLEVKSPFSLLEKFFIAGIFIEIIYVLLKTFALPIVAFDAVAIYGIKAKSFYINGTVLTDIFNYKTCDFFNLAHPDYPLFLPLAESWLYKLMGTLNDLLVKILFPIYLIGTIVIFYSMMVRFFKRKTSLMFTFFLSSIPQFFNYGTNGYADILVTFYFTASFLYLFLWIKKKKCLSLYFLACSLFLVPGPKTKVVCFSG